MSDIPIPMRWQGDGFTPINSRWAKEADKAFVVGEVYRIDTVEERSSASHRHYFAAVNQAWLNLPERLSEQFDTPEKLRKYALIKVGYCDQRSIVCASKAEAHRVAAFMRPMDEYALVLPFDNTVTVWTAKSQSLKAMDRKTFNESKQKVLDLLASMVGVQPHELQTEAA